MSNLQPSIDNAEHVGPDTTGDNVQAKRVVNYYWDGTNWQRSPAPFMSSAYDYISYTSGSTTDTYVFKSGGSGGITVSTITITYTDSTKATLSNVART